MSARDPREECGIVVSMGDRDENGDDLPNGLAWAMWGIFDGHAGPYTANVVRKLLPRYVVDELFIRAGTNPKYKFRDSRYIFQNRTLHDIVQAIKDAFQRLDNDLLKKAGQAITGSKPLHASMRDIAPAESGSCALLATYDTVSRYLFVANVGNARAVLGQRNDQGTWEARSLSIEHTCHNEEEVVRLQAEHPNETEMIQDGRLLGSAVTRAFGDLSEQAVELVGRWLEKNDPSKPAKAEFSADAFDQEAQEQALETGMVVRKPEDLPVRGREYTKVKRGDERHWVVMDDNAATHLARNALGGADEDVFDVSYEKAKVSPYALLYGLVVPSKRFAAKMRPRQVPLGEG
ncbi:MAG: hypothetical protein Q9209_003682 [Squamulea sp. 1 TL-2023]